MIESISIRGFQTHRSLTLAFDPQLTSLTGPTDSGKTSILRALRWVFLNQGPKDKDLVNWDDSICRVTVVVDGHRITRRKGKEKNTYALDGRIFKSFGTTVPAEIKSLLNVGEVNFQGQLDPHFWFNETPGQLSKTLNDIINLGDIDRVLGGLASEQRRARTVFEDRLESSKAARAELKKLSWVSDFLKAHELLKDRERVIGELFATVSGLRFLVQQGQVARKRARNAARAREQAREIGVKGRLLLDLWDSTAKLKRLVAECKEASRPVGPHPKRISRMWGELESARERTDTLRALIEEYRSWQEKEEDLRNSRRTLGTLLRKLTGGRCPTCQRPWPLTPKTSSPTSSPTST